MKFYDFGLWMFSALALAALILGGANIYFKDYYPDDNIFEEIVETKIQEYSGYDLDLSPDSEENKR